VLDSLSRLMPSITTAEHLQKVRSLRLLLSAHARSEDLIRIGAYQHGGDPNLDKAIAALPTILKFLQQDSKDRAPLEHNIRSLIEMPA
jgi:flagellum-specific ATP synthase